MPRFLYSSRPFSSKEKIDAGVAYVKGPGFKSQYVHEKKKSWRVEVVHNFFPLSSCFFVFVFGNFNFSFGSL
jgi:hypothetical protein